MAKENSKAKKVIIPVVAVVLAAAMLVTGYFRLYKPKQGAAEVSGGGSDTKQSLKITPAEVGYETADYKGHKVPAEFVEIFEQAEKDSEKACKKYGVAMTVGENEISETEFAMTYFDVFTYMLSGEIEDPMNLKPEATSAPSEQPYGNSGLTWADRVKEETEKTLKKRYIFFSEALENGFLPSDSLVEGMIEFYEEVIANAENKGISTDKEIASSYSDGATLGLCTRNLILRGYASEYEEAVRTEMYQAYSDKEVKGIYEKDPSKYNFIDAHILEIPNDDSEGISRAKRDIKDIDSFKDFAVDYYSARIGNYDQIYERETRQHFIKYDELVENFNNAVAGWCFADGRKEGDFGVVRGDSFSSLIFMEKPQYSPESANYHECVTLYNSSAQPPQSTEEEEAAEEETRSLYQWFVNDGCDIGVLENIAEIYNQSYNSYYTRGKCEKVYVSSMDYNIARWLYSSGKKPGDYDMIRCNYGTGIYYFDGLNEGDLDAYDQIRTEKMEADFDSYMESLEKYNGYKVSVADGIENKAAAKGEKACAKYAGNVSKQQSES